MRNRLLTASAFVATVCIAAEKAGPEQLEFFETRIRPVLVKNCYMCHSKQAKSSRGGLVVDTRESIRAGGDSGAAIVPGKPEESRLLKAIRYDGKLQMPPMGKLPATVIADFEKWIAMGATDPREGDAPVAYAKIDFEAARKTWLYSTPRLPATPVVKSGAWAKSPIDRFVAAKQASSGVTPVADADRRTWIRRATFDLTGLPPTPEEIEAFITDRDKDAFARVVDRLLASERFGERWGRHWLDVARYAETEGRTRNQAFPVAWRYRDYVIKAFNDDKAYDRFILEQLAGDLLPAAGSSERNVNLVATGFLALGAHDLNELDPRTFQADVIDEQIGVTSKAFLGLTVGCARCHDHKFDPIPTRDYYGMAGIFRSTEMRQGLRRRPPLNQYYFFPPMLNRLQGVEPYPGKSREEVAAIIEKQDRLYAAMQQSVTPRNRPELRKLAVELAAIPLPANLVMGAAESAKAENSAINIRGDVHSLGEVVPRGIPQVLVGTGGAPAIAPTESGRLQLANFIANRANPLTARVMANRVWQHLFGVGIVETPDNFGNSGSKPSHPELLDYLAVRFMDQGWSVKKLIREITLSRVYRLSSDYDARNFEKEPANKTLWRANRRRLEAEALRDAILQVSGSLRTQPPEASPVYDWRRIGEPARGDQVQRWELTESYRSVYLPVIRNVPSRFFETFDFPEPSETRGRRDVTTVAPQALFLMNSPFVLEQARTAAERLLAKATADDERVRRAWRSALGREPSTSELDRALKFVSETAEFSEDSSETQRRHDAWARLYHSLFASAEFRYRS
jgi:hypothetical protein